MQPDLAGESRLVVDEDGLQRLIEHLAADGYDVIGPHLDRGAIVLAPIAGLTDLPAGCHDEQDAGHYRVGTGGRRALFDHAAPAQPWKRYLYPPAERLWQARSEGGGFEIVAEDAAPQRYALFGMRACDLTAMRVLDTVLGARGAGEVRYMARRQNSFVVAANCTRSGATCFCASMGSGPQAKAGFDLALTELADGEAPPSYLVSVGSEKGTKAVAGLGARSATAEEREAEAQAIERAASGQARSMVPDVADLLRRNLEHRQWAQVAERCLGCANCTMVCPTCFCANVEDVTDLSGSVAERWRKWDSCFTNDFTYIHGGSIRRSGGARYRQWITHKLSTWWQQFETSGCVGCGRCITWCPVGIDITEEARNLRDSEGGSER